MATADAIRSRMCRSDAPRMEIVIGLSLDSVINRYIRTVLVACDDSDSEAAKVLGIHRTTVARYRKR